MTGSGHEIKIRFVDYVFTTWLLALFHYVFSRDIAVRRRILQAKTNSFLRNIG